MPPRLELLSATRTSGIAYVPGGIEGFFIEAGEASAAGPPDPAEIAGLSARYDIYFAEG